LGATARISTPDLMRWKAQTGKYVVNGGLEMEKRIIVAIIIIIIIMAKCGIDNLTLFSK
jgi:phage gp46-like protein